MKNKLTFKKLIIIVLVIIFAISYVRQFMAMKRIEKEISSKQSQLELINQKNDRLQDEVDKINSNSPEYLERLARERLGMIKPGEKVINSSDSKEDSSN